MKLIITLFLLTNIIFTDILVEHKHIDECEKAQSLAQQQQYQKAINIALITCDLSETSNLNFIASCYNKLNDHYKEINYLEQVIIINDEISNFSNLVINYIKIAKAYRKLNTKHKIYKSIEYLNNALKLEKKTTIQDTTKYSIYNNIGNYHRALTNFKKANDYYLKAIKIAKKLNSNKRIAKTHSNISTIYINSKATESELIEAKKHIKIALKLDSVSFPEIHTNLGITNYLSGDFVLAITNHDQALKLLTESKKTAEKLNFEDILNSKNKNLLLNTLFEKTYALIKLNKLDKGLDVVKLADKIIDYMLIKTKTEKTKLLLRKKAFHFYYLALHICHKQNKTSDAFYFLEKSKALILLNQTLTKNSFILPENVKNKEVKLKKGIFLLEERLKKSNKKSTIVKLQKKIFDNNIKLKLLIDSVELVYPEYKKIKRDLNHIQNLNDVQKNLNNKDICIVSYLWDKSENQFNSLYGIAITSDKTELFKIKDLEIFKQKVLKLKNQLAKPHKKLKDKTLYEETAKSLYSDLFPNKINKLIKSKKLIIIPDSDLQSIPFEALINNNNKYLIKEHEISYAYSTSYLDKNNHKFRNPKNNLTSFAPETFSYDNLTQLPGSKNEAEKIAELFSGDINTNDRASKDIFIKKLNNYKIIHLSTHSDANNAPWIAFKDKKLKLEEIYNTENQAELIVLNTCNSSLGKINSGEGVFSLARGFFYSGAKSVISSLWNVNDKSNSEITINFYKYLKKGKTKSAALRQAKLDYLSTHSLSEASPYYWSSLILIGDDSTIELNNNNKYLIYSVIILTTLFLVIFFIKKSKMLGNKF